MIKLGFAREQVLIKTVTTSNLNILCNPQISALDIIEFLNLV